MEECGNQRHHEQRTQTDSDRAELLHIEQLEQVDDEKDGFQGEYQRNRVAVVAQKNAVGVGAKSGFDTRVVELATKSFHSWASF